MPRRRRWAAQSNEAGPGSRCSSERRRPSSASSAPMPTRGASTQRGRRSRRRAPSSGPPATSISAELPNAEGRGRETRWAASGSSRPSSIRSELGIQGGQTPLAHQRAAHHEQQRQARERTSAQGHEPATGQRAGSQGHTGTQRRQGEPEREASRRHLPRAAAQRAGPAGGSAVPSLGCRGCGRRIGGPAGAVPRAVRARVAPAGRCRRSPAAPRGPFPFRAHLTAAAPRAASRAASLRFPPPRRAPRPRQSRPLLAVLDDPLGQRGTDPVDLVELLDGGRAEAGLDPGARFGGSGAGRGVRGPRPSGRRRPAARRSAARPAPEPPGSRRPAPPFEPGRPLARSPWPRARPRPRGTGRAAERRRPRARRPLRPRHLSRPVAAGGRSSFTRPAGGSPWASSSRSSARTTTTAAAPQTTIDPRSCSGTTRT